MMLAHYATRGRKYEIKIFKEDDGTYSIRDYKNGLHSGSKVGHTEIQKVYITVCYMIHYANIYDSIRYEVVGNSDDLLSFEMVQASK